MIRFSDSIPNLIFSCKSIELIITCLDSLGTSVRIKYIELFSEDAMQHEDIENLAVILNNSGHYRVTKKYQRPEYYNTGNEDNKMIAVFLDIEACILKISSKRYS